MEFDEPCLKVKSALKDKAALESEINTVDWLDRCRCLYVQSNLVWQAFGDTGVLGLDIGTCPVARVTLGSIYPVVWCTVWCTVGWDCLQYVRIILNSHGYIVQARVIFDRPGRLQGR